MPMSKTKELFCTFFKIGAFTFGGGYAMVALLEHEFVEEKRWLTREEFLDMVAIAESTPGPVAVNSATYVGYKIEGVLPVRQLLPWRCVCRPLQSFTLFRSSSTAFCS